MPTNGLNGSSSKSTGAEVYIVSAVRTPIGSIRGSLSSLKATQLASVAVKSALERISLAPDAVERVIVGQAVQAGSGQAPAKQVLIGAGIPANRRDQLVNEVCASGMQAIILGALQIKYMGANCVVSAGMESMSNVPYYVPRVVPSYGGFKSDDGLIVDGLTDTFNNSHMGDCAEHTAKKHTITRDDQDNYAIESYMRARDAAEQGVLAREICEVSVVTRKNQPPIIVNEDEEFKKLDTNRIRSLAPYFDKTSGTITAANASSLGDGAAACVLMSASFMEKQNLKPMAKIVSYGEGACDPIDFATSPVDAVNDALSKAGLSKDDIALWEINEAFSVVAVANIKLLGLNPAKVNVNGGGVSLGHPLGMSGARIVNSLAHQLKSGEYGCAAICRGGGGSAAMVIQKL